MSGGGEMAGVELVCRLMAATPPYLYNPNGPPHCYFFSDLLRGLVAKRCTSSPPTDDLVTTKRLRLASIGSAFSTKTGNREELGPRSLAHTSNPLSPSSFLPRLDVLYRKLNEIERTARTESPVDDASPAQVAPIKNETDLSKNL